MRLGLATQHRFRHWSNRESAFKLKNGFHSGCERVPQSTSEGWPFTAYHFDNGHLLLRLLHLQFFRSFANRLGTCGSHTRPPIGPVSLADAVEEFLRTMGRVTMRC